MRILITNNTLADRRGTELVVRDLCLALRAHGHDIAAYSNVLGDVADEMRRSGIPTLDDLDYLPWRPDILHCQHHLEAMTALFRFPEVPAVYFCHGWLPWEEIPPLHPRILRYIAVDRPTYDAAISEHGIPPERIRIIPAFVDLDRFKPRSPLPDVPRRALVASNYVQEAHFSIIHEACSKKNISLEAIGLCIGKGERYPECVLGQYDLVFATGRAALEAAAVGTVVVMCGAFGIGPMVTTKNMRRLRTLDCDYEKMCSPLRVDRIVMQIERYDPVDSTEVSGWVRSNAGLDQAVLEIQEVYHEVIGDASRALLDDESAARAAAAYQAWLSGQVKHLRRSAAALDEI